MSYRIIPKYGHFEVYIGGAFFCSADSWTEAANEVEKFLLTTQN